MGVESLFPLAELSARRLAELYHAVVLQLHGVRRRAAFDNLTAEELRQLRDRTFSQFARQNEAEIGSRRSALVVGFIGRYNSGDELMLEMHLQLLNSLGFRDVDLWTELPQDVRDYYYPLYWNPRKPYDLVVMGGGGLDIAYGFYPAFLAKLRFGARVIFSSVNLPSDEEKYLAALGGLADLVITRNPADYRRLRQRLPQLRYLQDVATLYRSPQSLPRAERVAIVIRKDPQTVIDFAPDLPADVLVLSRDDREISAAYAKRFGCRLISLWNRAPTEHVDHLARYAHVMSVGRFHAALCAALHAIDYVYLFSAYFKPLPEHVLHAKGRLRWEQIREIAQHHVCETKIGLPSDRFADYQFATQQQYRALFREVLGDRMNIKDEG